MRIVSTFPTATEIICALGLGKQLVGVSHECNFPALAKEKPRVSSVDFDYVHATSSAIDSHVEQKMHEHKSLYNLNEQLLQKLQPTYIITQQLCDVCAITPSDIQRVIKNLQPQPEVLSINPTSLADICVEIMHLGKNLKRFEKAKVLVKKLQTKMTQIKKKTEGLNKKKVFCIEWIDPLFASGHWVPEMVEIAGGIDVLGYKNKPSRKISWDEVIKHDPEILIFMPCGYSFEKTKEEIKILYDLSFWKRLRAVQNNHVWLVDGPSYFNQSGPRVILNGIEILAKIIHPEVFGKSTTSEAILIK